MRKTLFVGLLAALGAFAGVVAIGNQSEAADEIRCRVNVEAFLKDLDTLKKTQRDIDTDVIKKLLQPKP